MNSKSSKNLRETYGISVSLYLQKRALRMITFLFDSLLYKKKYQRHQKRVGKKVVTGNLYRNLYGISKSYRLKLKTLKMVENGEIKAESDVIEI